MLVKPLRNGHRGHISFETSSGDTSLLSRMLRDYRLLALGRHEAALAQPLPDEDYGFVPIERTATCLLEAVLDPHNESIATEGNALKKFRHQVHRNHRFVTFEIYAVAGIIIRSFANRKGFSCPSRHGDTDKNQPQNGDTFLAAIWQLARFGGTQEEERAK